MSFIDDAKAFFRSIWWAITEFFRFFRESLAGFWALILTVIAFLVKAGDIAIEQVRALFDKLASMQLTNFDLSAPSGSGSFLAVVNTFFPLEELFGYLGLYVAVVVIMFAYRFGRSWLGKIIGFLLK